MENEATIGHRRATLHAPRKASILRVVAALLLTTALLLVASAPPLHEDEARYGVWALALLRGDPWLLDTPIDKPPLAFYPMALSLSLLGKSDLALRLPGVLATLLLLATLARLARREGLGGGRAVALALLSPILWASGPTALTDPPMVALALLAVERARADRPGQAGLAGALAFLAKPTALLLLPLVIAAAWPLDGARRSALVRGAALPLMLLWFWERERAEPSFWLLGSQAYGTLGIPSTALLAWGTLVLVALLPMVAVVALARRRGTSAHMADNDQGRPQGVPLPFVRAFVRAFVPTFQRSNAPPLHRSTAPPLHRSTALRSDGEGARRAPLPLQRSNAAVLALWLPIHLLLGFQPWERYLLPLVPVAALVAARCLPQGSLPPAARAGALAFLLLAPLGMGSLRLAPHDGRWEGIREIGARVPALAPGAPLFFRDSGDPLRWYGDGTRADLRWVGTRWPRCVALRGGHGYVVARAGERLPAPMEAWPLIHAAGHFELRGGDVLPHRCP